MTKPARGQLTRRAVALIAILVAVAILATGLQATTSAAQADGSTDPGSALSDDGALFDQYDEIEVYTNGSCSPAQSTWWQFGGQMAGYGAIFLIAAGVLMPWITPVVGTVLVTLGVTVGVAASISNLVASLVCTGTTVAPLMRLVHERLQRISRDAVDIALANELADVAASIDTLVQRRQGLLQQWTAGQLSDEDRSVLEGDMVLTGQRARVLLRRAMSGSFRFLPLVMPLALLEINAYLTAASVAKPGPFRDAYLTWALQTRDDALDGLRQMEDDYRATVRRITTASHRADYLESIPSSYLAGKATYGYHAAFGEAASGSEAFLLVNNTQADLCLGVPRPVDVRPGDALTTVACNADPATSAGASQLWSYLPGTPLLHHLASGLCLEEGTGAVRLLPCPAPLPDGTIAKTDVYSDTTGAIDDRAWGIHPAGYLVNLHTDRCLDPTGAGAGKAVTAGPCAYGAISRTDGLDAPEAGAAELPMTDQVWHVQPAARVTTTLDLSGQTDTVAVKSTPQGIRCGGGATACSVDLPIGTEVTLRAAGVGTEGFLADWSGACTGTASTCTFTVGLPATGATNTVHAWIERLQYVEVADDAHGTVDLAATATREALECQPTGPGGADVCRHWYPSSGGIVVATPAPDHGYLFDSWQGVCAPTSGPSCDIALGAPGVPGHNVSATFVEDPEFTFSSELEIHSPAPRVRRGRTAHLLVRVTSDRAVRPSGRVTAMIAGSRRVATLDQRGRARLSVTIPSAVSPGRHRIRVVYGGDHRIARTRATVRITVIR